MTVYKVPARAIYLGTLAHLVKKHTNVMSGTYFTGSNIVSTNTSTVVVVPLDTDKYSMPEGVSLIFHRKLRDKFANSRKDILFAPNDDGKSYKVWYEHPTESAELDLPDAQVIEGAFPAWENVFKISEQDLDESKSMKLDLKDYQEISMKDLGLFWKTKDIIQISGLHNKKWYISSVHNVQKTQHRYIQWHAVFRRSEIRQDKSDNAHLSLSTLLRECNAG